MITEYLTKLFEQHGVPSVIHNDWIVPNGELPSIRAFWYPRKFNGELEVQVVVRENVTIEECFGGVGEGDTGLRDALANFTINSFHVLLAALWERHDPEQVVKEDWEVNGKLYAAYVGNFGFRTTDGVAPDIPPDLFPRIQQTIQREPLTSDSHWFRFFLGYVAGEFTYEVMKDNESWDAGVGCLEASPWPESESFYTVRLFMILRAL